MESALEGYDKTLIFVSHDRYFIDRFAERIWAMKDGEITDFRGGFSEYRRYERSQQAAQPAVKKAETEKKDKKQKPRPANTARKAAVLEREIEAAERRLSEMETEMADAGSDYEKLMEIEGRKNELREEITAMYERLMEFEE